MELSQKLPQESEGPAIKIYPEAEIRVRMFHMGPLYGSQHKDAEGVQRCSASFVCNKFSHHESATAMLKELDWPYLQQRAEKKMALFHRVVNETVDVEASV